MSHRYAEGSQARRSKTRATIAKARVALPKPDRPPCSIDIDSGDGVLAFRLVCDASGIHVERSRQKPQAGRLVHLMHFHDDDSFKSWCESDGLRSSYPFLFDRLMKSVRGLLSSSS